MMATMAPAVASQDLGELAIAIAGSGDAPDGSHRTPSQRQKPSGDREP